ncbi:hypothetical protein POX_a01469 [Penicillium oxalicum]|uniref:Hydrophobin n=1 Tax=Penicillium oxalicum (strain 114-2 / CGMCC 5302) TaxID=933388 RepID=S8BEP3_PENO1|nr:hypothetical protein POX_a01469 [Penicillium oxalicum]EPS33537.1 hypothetical protein PDE_08499 [Penicillium oxalicum 114-2]KAI2794868.1 hypothetical protein POX_a01469 [Penicillium oxalicum]
MRASWWIGVCVLFAPSVIATETAPFAEPHIIESNKRAFEVLQILKRADNNCPWGYNPCTSLGNSNVCCRPDTSCSRDAADNIACCPTGAVCTGSLTGPSTATETGTSFMFPHGATATTTSSTIDPNGASITGSVIPGAYPFVYVPTTFPNSAVCSSYYSLCQSEYTQCTANLLGRYGVTVGGVGGAGVTVQAVTATSQATSICSSLSQQACHGLQLNYCASVATGAASEPSGNGALSTQSTSLYDLMAGVMVGIAAVFI